MHLHAVTFVTNCHLGKLTTEQLTIIMENVGFGMKYKFEGPSATLAAAGLEVTKEKRAR